MPIALFCPHCNTTLSVPDQYAGRRGRCRRCRESVKVPQSSDPAALAIVQEAIADADPVTEAEEAEIAAGPDDRRRPCPACGELILVTAVKCRYCRELFDPSLRGALAGHGIADDPGWNSIRSGIMKIYYAVALMVVTVILLGVVGGVLGGMGSLGGREEINPILMIGILIGGLLALVAKIVALVGQAQCTKVPVAANARGIMIGALISSVMATLLTMISTASAGDGAMHWGQLLSVVSTLLIIWFVYRCASYLGDGELMKSSQRLILFALVCVAAAIGAGVAGTAADSTPFMAIAAIVGIVGVLISLVWYTRLLKGLAATIETSSLA